MQRAWPLTARAQQGERIRRVGMIPTYAQDDREGQARVRRFSGYVPQARLGRSPQCRNRIQMGCEIEHVKVIAAELVRAAPDLILLSAPTTLAELERLTSTIPPCIRSGVGPRERRRELQ